MVTHLNVKSMTINYDGGLSGQLYIRKSPMIEPEEIGGNLLLIVGDSGHPASNHISGVLSELGVNSITTVEANNVHNTHTATNFDLIVVNRPIYTDVENPVFINYLTNAANNGVPLCLDPTTGLTSWPDDTRYSASQQGNNNVVYNMNLTTWDGWERQEFAEDGGRNAIITDGNTVITQGFPENAPIQIYLVNTFMMGMATDRGDFAGVSIYRNDPSVSFIANSVGCVCLERGAPNLIGETYGARIVWSNLFYAGQNSTSSSGAPHTVIGKEFLQRACLWAMREI